MIVLKRKRGIAGILIAAAAPLVMFFPALHPNLFSVYLLVGGGLIYIVLLFFWIKNGTKPAAWIKNDKLFIRSGAFAVSVINKEILEYIKYEKGHIQEMPKGEKRNIHAMYVKMKGFSEWQIYIDDQIEHLDGMRLFNFINENFHGIEVSSAKAA